MNKTRIAISASGTIWGSAVVKPSWNRAALDVWPGDYSPVNAPNLKFVRLCCAVPQKMRMRCPVTVT